MHRHNDVIDLTDTEASPPCDEWEWSPALLRRIEQIDEEKQKRKRDKKKRKCVVPTGIVFAIELPPPSSPSESKATFRVGDRVVKRSSPYGPEEVLRGRVFRVTHQIVDLNGYVLQYILTSDGPVGNYSQLDLALNANFFSSSDWDVTTVG